MFNHLNHNLAIPELQQITDPSGYRVYETPEGNRYPSVTTVLGSQDKSGLDEWRKRVGDKEADGIVKQAGERGTVIHDTLEKYLYNNPDYNKGLFPSDRLSIQKILPLVNRIDDIYFLEKRLYSNKLKIAGTADCIAHYDGVLSIIDFKTSRRKKKLEWIQDYFMQGSAYAACFYELTGIIIKDVVIIITVDHDDPQLFKIKVGDHLKRFIDIRRRYDE